MYLCPISKINMAKTSSNKLKQTKNIEIIGARVHNLKNINVSIPRNNFVVITGLSGSGKSSLAFDTLYAEGQRRYVESLSSYARQFLGRFDKPDVDAIHGISPAIAIEQKVNTRNPRSTVGTTTEIYDYLKLLYTRIGKTISPISGNEVKKHSVSDVVKFIESQELGARILISSPLFEIKKPILETLEVIKKQGFSRILLNNTTFRIEEIEKLETLPKVEDLNIVIDRVKAENSEENLNRISDSVQTAFYEGNGSCNILIDQKGSWIKTTFNNKFELDGELFEEPSAHFFSFNNPFGACKTCEGFGSVIGIDDKLVIPNQTKSIYEGAIACWKGESMSKWKDQLVINSHKFDFPIHKPINELTSEHYKLLWSGNKYFDGLNSFFKFLEENSFKIQFRVMLSRYRGKTSCPDCNGTRLRKDASYVLIQGKSISELVLLPVNELTYFFNIIELTDYEKNVSKRLLIEINNRIQYLIDVGLGYLTLNRLSSTLSGGESQRINLATSLGSSLVGSTYILDEPSIGLHSRDTLRLIEVLNKLKYQGNTVLVVEHDEEIMEAADQLIDLGPEAGSNGGELVYQGPYTTLNSDSKSLTLQYLSGVKKIDIPEQRRIAQKWITIHGARQNNLKNLTIKIPLKSLVCVTGVSGSGKSSLIGNVLYPALQRHFGGYGAVMGDFDRLEGNLNSIQHVEFINQHPIGKSSRSNPVTYIKAYDDIRSFYADLQLSKLRGFRSSHFSFNVDGGRCETCKGEGTITVEMQFMADIQLNCETCDGHRFNDEILEIRYRDKNISDLLNMTIDEAIVFFGQNENQAILKRISDKLQPLQDVGLGYVKMGQSSNTLSGGEAQRIKLASFLSKGAQSDKVMFIFDEPTTGLHFDDIKKLLNSLNRLLNNGHSIVIIEHNIDVIKTADWLIDLGPEGGQKGGNLVYEGTPEGLAECTVSYTGEFLKTKLGK